MSKFIQNSQTTQKPIEKNFHQTFPTIYIKQEKITRIVKYLFNKFANLAVEPFVLRKPNNGTNVILTIP